MNDIRMSASVVLLGENNLQREGLRRIIASDDFSVEVTDSCSAFIIDRDVHERVVELVVVDAENIDHCDLDHVEHIHHAYPDTKIVVLDGAFDLERMIKSFQSGADGYIVKSIASDPLIESLRLVILGEKVMPSALAQLLPEYVAKAHSLPSNSLAEVLSDRELETLGCLCMGDPNKVIARHLEISEATVKVHVKAILRKLHLKNRTQAVAWTHRANVDFSFLLHKRGRLSKADGAKYPPANASDLAA